MRRPFLASGKFERLIDSGEPWTAEAAARHIRWTNRKLALAAGLFGFLTSIVILTFAKMAVGKYSPSMPFFWFAWLLAGYFVVRHCAANNHVIPHIVDYHMSHQAADEGQPDDFDAKVFKAQ